MSSSEVPVRTSTSHLKYDCTVCGRNVGRNNLKTKRVVFRDMGVHGSTVQSRVVAWLCIIPQEDGSLSCLEADPAWQQPPLAGSPGMQNTHLNAPDVPDRPPVKIEADPDLLTTDAWGAEPAYVPDAS